jgi:uncharacterized membrane protein YhhN
VKTQLYLIPILAVTVIFLIRAEILKIRNQSFLFKPISTLLIITIAGLSLFEPAYNQTYSIGILVGLLFSFGGDLALLFQEKRKPFMIGLVFFLIAHIIYAATFSLLGRFTIWDILSAGILFAAGLAFYKLIERNLGAMKIPVIAYILIISLMVNRAFSTFASPSLSSAQAWMISIGAVLFYISDIILAANRFWRPWQYNRVSLAFYFSGQLLIALTGGFFT